MAVGLLRDSKGGIRVHFIIIFDPRKTATPPQLDQKHCLDNRSGIRREVKASVARLGARESLSKCSDTGKVLRYCSGFYELRG